MAFSSLGQFSSIYSSIYSKAIATPTIITATVASSTSASVAFTTVSGANSYTITSSPGSLTATGTSTPISVTGLTTGTTYTFSVTATNGHNTSGASSPSNSITSIATTINIIHTVAGDGTGNDIDSPYGIYVSSTGVIYISSYRINNIYKVDTTGTISQLAGTRSQGYSGDGGYATSASLNSPTGICLDTNGNIYIADKQNNVIRKINTSGIISTFAGNNSDGYSGDGGIASSAQLSCPIGICVDTNGNIYILEKSGRVRKVSTNKIITTVAGSAITGYSGDGGPATSATFNNPVAICISNTGVIYVADYNSSIIRKINANGIISTFSGIAGSLGFSGDDGPATSATLKNPYAVCVDNIGNVYISDYSNSRIRMVNTSGIITTVVGTGTNGFSGDGGLALSAQINNVRSLCTGPNGLVYIGDYSNKRIRTINNTV